MEHFSCNCNTRLASPPNSKRVQSRLRPVVRALLALPRLRDCRGLWTTKKTPVLFQILANTSSNTQSCRATNTSM
ncbi:hypothetical protein FKM82_027768 [Ascaphus truei]